MWHSETSILLLGTSTWGVLATGSMMRSEVFAADISLQRQLCARLLGALTKVELGCTGQGARLDQALSSAWAALSWSGSTNRFWNLLVLLLMGCMCEWDMQVARGHHRSSCLLRQVLDYKGKVMNLFKYFYLTYFIQPSEDLSSSRILMDAAVQPQRKFNYSYTHGDYSGVQVLSLWSQRWSALELTT